MSSEAKSEHLAPAAANTRSNSSPISASPVSSNTTTMAEHGNHKSQQKVLKRESAHRVFVNRSLQLSKIKFFGFDMDYTLALYKSPQYENLSFKLIIDQLVLLGYPSDIKYFEYDPSFPVRGLWYDKVYGNLLKMDGYGNILICIQGFKFLKSNEIYKYYPNKYVNFDESRYCVFHTLFNLPEIYLLACLINYFTTSPHFEHLDTGVKSGDIFMSFKAIFQDVRYAVDYVHSNQGSLKQLTIENIEEYVVRDARLATLFNRMHENNTKVFLLTNSGYAYTEKIMSFMLNDIEKGRSWKSYFDYILVDAQKPLFFAEGTSLKEIDYATGAKKFGSHSGPLKKDYIYSGGSCDVFSKLIGSRGKDVLYVGDHIFGDIIKSKKERAWRTFLVIPELSQELVIWHEKRDIFNELANLDRQLAQRLIDFDSSSKTCPDISNIKTQIQKCVHEMDMQYGLLGSLFRSGSRQTHFASQVTRYADIYAASHLNLLHYPFFYLFKSPPMLMPHESTVYHDDQFGDEPLMTRFSRASSMVSVDGSTPHGTEIQNLIQAAARLHRPSVSPTTLNKNIYYGSPVLPNNAPTGSTSTTSSTAPSTNASYLPELVSNFHIEQQGSRVSVGEPGNPDASTSSSSGSSDVIETSAASAIPPASGSAGGSKTPQMRPDTPSGITHHQDLDDDDDELDVVAESSKTPSPNDGQ